MNILDRLSSLRGVMLQHGVDGYLILGTDPHLSEYVPDAWKGLEWISGFNGSYGKVAITLDHVALWTDSRYFIQAETQLSGTGIVMIKDRLADTISVGDWFAQGLRTGTNVAIDGQTVSASEANMLEKQLGAKGMVLSLDIDLLSNVWDNRPNFPQSPITDYPVAFAGLGREEKLVRIRKKLIETGAVATLICQLDDLAWSFNLRGNDIDYNPLFTGYGYIDQQQAVLFIDLAKISQGLTEDLERAGVQVIGYGSLFSFLGKLEPDTICLDPDRTNSLVYGHISKRCKIIDGLSVPTLLKSVKNDIEVTGMREAHIRDGVAMVNFLYWFDQNFGKERITELTVAEKLKGYRSEQRLFMGESFCPIVGFGPHGAIVHYSATPETDVEIVKDSIFLFDSGGHYLDGTTDITRTIATGTVTSRQQSDFTLVLKGMIQLANVVFPEGIKGHSLDLLARKALWDNGLNYGHGTGHGVGHYSSVHEGPMAIRQDFNQWPIEVGQVLSDEPGLYRTGEYGIRTENVLVCREYSQTEFGKFLFFETLTLCPIDKKLIDPNLMTDAEIYWLNTYHARVIHELGPHVSQETKKWLTIQCGPISK